MKPKNMGNSNFIDKLFHRWVNGLISIAQTKSLEISDFKDLEIDGNSQELFNHFSAVFESVPVSKYALVKTLLRTLRFDVIHFFFWQLIMAITQFSIPIMIKEIIEVTQNQQISLLYYYLCILILIRFISNMSINMSKYLNVTVGNDAYLILAMAIMDKSLKVSFLSNLTHTSGQVINLLQVDALRLQLILQWVGLLILCPIQIIIAVTLLFYYIGWEFVGGLIIIILFILINGYIGKQIQIKQKILLQAKDERMNAEILVFQQIKFVKINAYEQWFEEKLEKLRKIECEALRYRFIISALCVFTSWLGPILIFITTFSCMYYSGNEFTTQKIFILLNFITMLQPQIIMFPQAISEILQILLNMKRIQEFLYTKEMMTDCMINNNNGQPTVNIVNGDFYWPKNQLQVQSGQPEIQVYSIKLTLKDIKIQLKNNQLIAIIGDIGSGKSSLIFSILGEMLYNENISNPEITRNGRLAYVGQRPWVMNASVKDNILFGLEFDPQRYQEALRYSQLETDLKILKKSDQTMIGEKGVNISGGQKTRIAIARAIYSDADIIIMDDPLSAVDAYVGNYLMNECFSKYLSGKLRILVTHNLSLLGLADHVIVMNQGVIEFQGKFDEFKQSQYYTVTANYHSSISNELLIEGQQKITQENDETSADSMMISQNREKQEISLQTFRDYFNYTNGFIYVITLLILQICWIMSYVLSILELSKWSKSQTQDNEYYLTRYTFFSVLQVIFVFLRPFSVLQNSVNTSKKLHNKIIKCLFKADLCSFFERVPVGRILNMLSKDLNVLDQEMFWSLSWFLAQLNLLISNLIIYVYSTTPLVICPILIYMFACNLIKNYFTKASTELQRLETITKGPMLSYFSECLTNGLISIRAYNKQADTLQQHSFNLDQNRKVFILLNAVNAWFMARLGVASFILNVIVIMYSVTYLQISPASIALILSFATALDFNISSGFQAFSTYQLNFVAFENCRSMTMIKPEEVVENSVEMQVQFKGMVEFKDFSVKYRPNLPPALKSISLAIKPNEKIGVVGRTGAGKSTITLSLLRILNGFSGNLYIDGKDILSISLKYLRQNITMIMQEPNLFTGTIKENLDPFSVYDDQTILEAIEKCCLSDLIHKRDGLNSYLSDGGKNLSEGERQLLCIARAVLKKSKIILIDEATANIDLETDKKIQETIQNVFRDCTVITIAHRVSTILYCDKILVIENGEVAEFDETNVLLQNPNSKFSKLHNQTKVL